MPTNQMSRSLSLFSVVMFASMITMCGCWSSDVASDSGPSEKIDSPPASVTVPPAIETISVPDAPPQVSAVSDTPIPEPVPMVAEPDVKPDVAPDVAPDVVADQEAAAPGLRSNPLRDDSTAGDESIGTSEEVEEASEPPFDPVKVYGSFFVDWPEPKLTLVITGRQDGYLEPCGCAGKERMKGGLSRRHSLFEDLREARGWTTVGLDVGGMVLDSGRQAEMKFQTTAEAFSTMGYDAIGLGTGELRLQAALLVSFVASAGSQRSPFVSANVGLFGFDTGFTEKQQIVEAAGMKLGITSIFGKEYQKEINNSEIEMVDPEVALAPLVPALKEQCDLLILLAHATMEESIELARKFPDFDLVVTAGGPPEPPPVPEKIEGTDTLLIQVGTKGENATVLGIYEESRQAIRYQRVTIDSRYPDSPGIRQLMALYQEQLRVTGLEGLGIRPIPHASKEILGKFVGSQECKSCHEESYKVWKKSGHAKAWNTLVIQDPPRTFDPECISCHVIGWNPTHYFPYESGFLSEAETPGLIDVGCESCHGPGGAHVRAEMGADVELQRKLQEASVVTKEEAQKRLCTECHDLDNSPDFEFETYWPKVEHYDFPEEP